MSCAEKNGMNLICVTLNAPNDWTDHKELLNFGFSKYEERIVASKGVKATEFTYDKENKKSVDLIFSRDFCLAACDNDEISTDIEYKGLKIPAKKGTVAAYMNVYCNGNKIDAIELVTEKEIKKTGFFKLLFAKIRKFFLLIFGR